MTPTKRLPVWLAKDPETDRVTAQAREFGDGDFPRGARGRDWPIRQTAVPAKAWRALLSADLSPSEQDDAHRQWWTQAAPEGVDPWPA